MAIVVGLVSVVGLLLATPPTWGRAVVANSLAQAGSCRTTTTLTVPRSVVWGRPAKARVTVTSRCGVPRGVCRLTVGDGIQFMHTDGRGRCVYSRFVLDRLGRQQLRATFLPQAGWRTSRSPVTPFVVTRPAVALQPAIVLEGTRFAPNGIVGPGDLPIVPFATPLVWCAGDAGSLAFVFTATSRADDTFSVRVTRPDGTTEAYGPLALDDGFGVFHARQEVTLAFRPSLPGTVHIDLQLRRPGVTASLASSSADITVACDTPPAA